jgi:very-short-patch-repair endonuclease
MHQLDVQPANPVQVAAAGLESREGVEVRQSDLDGETEEIRGVRVSTLRRTLLDLCAWLPAVEALVVLDMAITRTGAECLRKYADSVNGRAGSARLRQLVDVAAPAESPMETRIRWLVLSAGLPKPQVQSELYDEAGNFLGRADLYYPQAHLVIEFDGGNHRDRLVSDDRRQNSLINAGYRILRFTSADVYGRPHGIVAEVRAAVRGYRSGR